MKDLLSIIIQLCAGVAATFVFQAILSHTRLGVWIDRGFDWLVDRLPWVRQWHVLAAVLLVGFVALVLGGRLP